jgi:glutamate racemase
MKNYDNRAIGVFDSGLGGLTIMKSIMKIMPNEKIIYFGDNAKAPYGDKSKKEIIELALKAVVFFKNKNIKALVIACNTVCAYAYDLIKGKLNLPVFEIISSSLNELLKNTVSSRVGIMATKATIYSHVYRDCILKKNPNICVTSVSCPLLVPLIEGKGVNLKLMYKVVGYYLLELKKKKIDVLLLACTHYPFIKNVIEKFMVKK